jgi:hypothetical protein
VKPVTVRFTFGDTTKSHTITFGVLMQARGDQIWLIATVLRSCATIAWREEQRRKR